MLCLVDTVSNDITIVYRGIVATLAISVGTSFYFLVHSQLLLFCYCFGNILFQFSDGQFKKKTESPRLSI